MTPCGFERDALEEYREAALYYAEQRRGLGGEFVAAVEAAVASICAKPEQYQAVGDGVRIFRLRRFPYFIFYRHESDRQRVVIYAVVHHRRRPDYWRERLPR